MLASWIYSITSLLFNRARSLPASGSSEEAHQGDDLTPGTTSKSDSRAVASASSLEKKLVEVLLVCSLDGMGFKRSSLTKDTVSKLGQNHQWLYARTDSGHFLVRRQNAVNTKRCHQPVLLSCHLQHSNNRLHGPLFVWDFHSDRGDQKVRASF